MKTAEVLYYRARKNREGEDLYWQARVRAQGFKVFYTDINEFDIVLSSVTKYLKSTTAVAHERRRPTTP